MKISMDGKRRYSDNIFVQRLWRTVKYEKAGFSTEPLCAACVTRSGIDFKRKQAVPA